MPDARGLGILEGMEVISLDGERVGSIATVDMDERGIGPENGVVTVQPPGRGRSRLVIPFSAVRTVEPGRVVLDVTAEELRAQAWGPERSE